jgi:hypothetical protein
MKKAILLFLFCAFIASAQPLPRQIIWFDHQLNFAEKLINANHRNDLFPMLEALDRQRDQAVYLYRQGQNRRADRIIRNATVKLWSVLRPMISVPVEITHRRALHNLINAEARIDKTDRKSLKRLHQARDAYRKGLIAIVQKQPAKALAAFKETIDLAQKTLQSDSRRDKEDAAREFRMLYSRAEIAANHCPDDRAKKLFEQLRELRSSIQSAQKNGNRHLVISLSKTAIRLSLRIIDLCEGDNLTSQDQIYADLDLLAEILDIAKDNLENLPNRTTAHKAYERAQTLYNQAEKAATNQEFQLAEQHLQEARALLARVLSDTKPGNLSQRAQEQIDRLDRKLENTSESDIVKPDFFSAASRFKIKAEQTIDVNNLDLALEYILAANRMLELALNSATMQNNQSTESIRTDLLTLETRLLNPADQSGSDDKDLRAAALEIIQWGIEALENNHLYLAFELHTIARNMVN